jgi:predicted nucleotidyltransferase
MTMPKFGLPDNTIATVRNILAQCEMIEQAILYGSRAKGNYKLGSDIDLTLIGLKLTDRMLAKIAGQLDESNIPYQVDLSIKNNIDNPNLLEHIDRVGVVFYQREDVEHS